MAPSPMNPHDASLAAAWEKCLIPVNIRDEAVRRNTADGSEGAIIAAELAYHGHSA